MHSLDDADLYAGLTDFDLASSVDLGDGLALIPTHAKFLTPLTLVNTLPPSPDPLKPKPAYWQSAGKERTITAQLLVPRQAAKSFDERFELARFIVLVLRLWSDPGIGLDVVASHKFEELCDLSETSRPAIFPVETWRRYYSLGIVDPASVTSSLSWVKDNWKTAYQLYSSSAEFRLAADSLDAGQFIPNHALTLVSLWASLEALFSPSASELKFRVSALIAAYLEPPGTERLELQKQVASLYDIRSAAAHGKPRHESKHLLKSFELVRKVLIRMISEKSVPSKEVLERRLFGAA